MSLSAAIIEALIGEGMDATAILRVARASEVKADPTNAARQARYRENKRNGVTVTALSPNDNSTLNPEDSLPQEAKASLPQGAKKRVSWPCPPNVKPAHWADLMANRKRKRCAQTQTALDGLLADIDRIADDEWPPGRLVEYAAAKGWASINDPRETLSGTGNGKRPNQSGWQAAYHANMGVGGHG